MSVIENVSRRRFIGGVFQAGAFVLAARVAPASLFAQQVGTPRTRAEAAALNPSIYLGIQPDGSVFIVTHKRKSGRAFTLMDATALSTYRRSSISGASDAHARSGMRLPSSSTTIPPRIIAETTLDA